MGKRNSFSCGRKKRRGKKEEEIVGVGKGREAEERWNLFSLYVI